MADSMGPEFFVVGAKKEPTRPSFYLGKASPCRFLCDLHNKFSPNGYHGFAPSRANSH
jgi:hypothetical protein